MKHIREKRRERRKNLIKKSMITLMLLMVLGGVSLGVVLYGPSSGFRDWLVTVSMTSMTHQWIAKLFYSDEQIEEILRNNRVEEIDEDTDTSSINTATVEEEIKEVTYDNEYDKQLFAKDLDEEEYNIYAQTDSYRIIKIKGEGYTGLLAAIYDPSKVKAMVSSKLGITGEYLTDMSKANNAVLAINGGRFFDKGGHGSGAAPRGITFVDGECKSTYPYTFAGGIVGFNTDNVLILSSKCTKANAEALNIRDCVCCGPFLIVNGKPSKVFGNGGWGTAPRTALGQRKDGVVLMLVLDGRIFGRPGADMDDIIEIMQNYGAYNAANLDGGTSTAMTLNYEVINDPVDASGTHRTRPIATGFGLVEKKESIYIDFFEEDDDDDDEIEMDIFEEIE